MAEAEAAHRIKRMLPMSLRSNINALSRSWLQKYDGSVEEKRQVSAPPPDRPIDHDTPLSFEQPLLSISGEAHLCTRKLPSPLSAFPALPRRLPDQS